MDDDGWLTKAEAAAQLGVAERTVERLAARGALTARMRPGFPTMYNPADVSREAAAARTVHRAAISLVDRNGNGHDPRTALERAAYAPPGDELLGPALRFLERLTALLPEGPTGPTGPTAPLFLTVEEAALESHLPARELRRFIREGKLVPVCGRSVRTWRIRRRDLEAL